MAKPEVGITGDSSTESWWFVWYDCDEYTDCLMGGQPTKQEAMDAAGRLWAAEPGDIRNVRLVSTVTITEVSTVVTEPTPEDIDYAIWRAKEANNG